MNLGQGFARRWQGFSLVQKVLFLVAIITLLISVFLFGQQFNSSTMVPLFTDLDPKDAAAVIDRLKELNVKYQLTRQGSTVMVPEQKVYELRLQLATSGTVTSGGVGFELFDQAKLGITDFERRLNFQRALQEELRRTIIQLDEVEQARIHLALPEKSVFAEDETPASASVALKLKSMRKLKKEHVQGIVMLVANSVEGLQPENVTVIDMAGNVLSGSSGGEHAGDAEQSLKRYEIKKALERQIEQQVQTMLEKILGPGKAVAVVNVDLDFNKREKRSVTYGNQVLRSETGLKEDNTTSSLDQPKVPGVDSNVEDYSALDQETEPNSDQTSRTDFSTREEYTRNYEVDTTEETYVFSPGEIKKISTAVVVDTKLSSEKMVELENLVAAAIGLETERGDQLTVSNMTFDNTLAEEMTKAMEVFSQQMAVVELQETRKQWAKIGVGLLAVVVSGFIVYKLISMANASALEVQLSHPVAVKHIVSEPVLSAEDLQVKTKNDKAKRYVEEQPEEAANILKTWLTYDE